MEVKLVPDHSALHPSSNGENDTQIRVCMLKLYMVKFLGKSGQVVVNNEITIW